MKPRIITGSAKGRKLEVPQKGTRPMMDRVKSAMFSILNPVIQDSHILDLYAGTGALGIECLSRGAKSATFIDKSKYAVRCIKINLKTTGFSNLAKVFKCSTYRFLQEFESFELPTNSFDIIFFTPPYKKFKEKVLALTHKLMKPNSILIAEHSSNRTIKSRVGELERFDERKYGSTTLTFYQKGELNK